MPKKPSKIAQARREVASKSVHALERETAEKWAMRAAACYGQYAETGDASWVSRGDDYRHESVEHAALVLDGGRTVKRVQEMVDRARKKYVRGKRGRFCACP